MVGMKLGEYQLLERIGQGGMGVVYRGVHPVIKKRVAVKILRGELAGDAGQVQRLMAEAEAVNTIGHRGIVDIFGFGRTPLGNAYVVMELLDGEPLSARLRERECAKGMPVSEAVDVLSQLCAALAAAHHSGVVHRDLKPSNVFIVRETNGDRFVKLLDFGIAKRPNDSGNPLTRPGTVVGTLEYMSPEQCRGETVTARSDLYALGAMAFEMLTGRRIFTARNELDLMRAQVEERPVPVLELRADCPPELAALVAELLEKAPERRPASAQEVGERLRNIGGQLATRALNPKPRPRRSRLVPALAASAAVLVVAAAVTVYLVGGAAPVPNVVDAPEVTAPAAQAAVEPPRPEPAPAAEPPRPEVPAKPATERARPIARSRARASKVAASPALAAPPAATPTAEQLRADIVALERELKAASEPDPSALLLLNTLRLRASGAPNDEQRLAIARSLDQLKSNLQHP